jgi:septal ring factor EnvC (AmiA/AmiB activator)
MNLLLTHFICIFLLLSPPLLANNDKLVKQKQLSQINTRIEKLRQSIEVKENSKSSYNRQLRSIEKKIGEISREIRDSNNKIERRQRSLSQLREEKKHIQISIDGHNRNLSQHLHSAYTMGQQEQLKLLFTQSDASMMQRNLTYYEYFSRHRVKLIQSAQKNFQQLSGKELEIREVKHALEQELANQRQQKEDLVRDKSTRKAILASIDEELKNQGKNLSQLEENARDLKQLINSIAEILTDTPSQSQPHKKFAGLRGELAWPVKGNVKKLFGRPKPPSNLRWQGVIIEAPSGNNVRAVSHGRVAFADWLRGMGNLIIIDHGQGYLSLYGHNQSLFKTAGDWVEAGDIIGSIGSSGGQKDPGLYFEIRKKGKPQNPSRWCKASNWFAT